MMVFDTAYTYEFLIKRELSVLVTSRDIDGYFEHVWTVHAVASLFCLASSGLRYGRPVVRQLNGRHTHIEGKIGRFEKMKWFPALNFVIAQVDLMWLLLGLIKKNRIDIIRAEDPYFNGMLGFIISVINKLPLVIGVWGNPEAIRKETKKPLSPRLKWIWLEKLLERFILRRTDMVIAGNIDNMAFVLRQGVHHKCTAIISIGNAINPFHYVPPDKRESGTADLEALGVSGQNVLLCITRLEPLKLPDHLIRALACMKGKGLNIKALFVGDGGAKDSLVALSEELGVADQIIFCGNRSQDWLARVIPYSAVVVSPLTGRALAEAALGGAPIVAYDIDWHSEVIETGITGELVPYLNYSLMADAIEKILKNNEYALMVRGNVRERALKMMDPQATDDVMIGIYEKLIIPKANNL
jgi:glycosyltransferase involved in cell wall biosynthesis